MSAKAHINPNILPWMRERGGLDMGDAARVASISPDQLARWEAGESQPTFLQAQKLAQALHAPFGYLFLAEPPAENLPLHHQDAEPLPFVARFATDAPVRAVAADMRAVLGIDIEIGQRNWEVYFRQLVDAAEAAGSTASLPERVVELAAFRNKPGGGGNFYRNASVKNSERFARAVLAEALSGRLLLRDAGRLLGVQPGKLQLLAGEREQ